MSVSYDQRLKVEIVGWADDWQPGWVECCFVDRFGRAWQVTDKVPVVTMEDLRPDSVYPRPGLLPCFIKSASADDAGHATCVIETCLGGTQEDTFEVFADQLVAADP